MEGYRLGRRHVEAGKNCWVAEAQHHLVVLRNSPAVVVGYRNSSDWPEESKLARRLADCYTDSPRLRSKTGDYCIEPDHDRQEWFLRPNQFLGTVSYLDDGDGAQLHS